MCHFNIFKKKKKMEEKLTEEASNVLVYPPEVLSDIYYYFSMKSVCRRVYEPRAYFNALHEWLDKIETEKDKYTWIEEKQIEELRTSTETILKGIAGFIEVYRDVSKSLPIYE